MQGRFPEKICLGRSDDLAKQIDYTQYTLNASQQEINSDDGRILERPMSIIIIIIRVRRKGSER